MKAIALQYMSPPKTCHTLPFKRRQQACNTYHAKNHITHCHSNEGNEPAIPITPKNISCHYNKVGAVPSQYLSCIETYHNTAPSYGSICVVPITGKITHHLQYIWCESTLLQYLLDWNEYGIIVQILFDTMTLLSIMVHTF